MKHSVLIKAFDIGDEVQELYWIAGTFFNERSDCLIRPILRGVETGKFTLCELPIGMLPILTIGRYYAHGQLLETNNRGSISSTTILDTSICSEVTSAELPQDLYSFGNHSAGKQRLLHYRVDDLDLFLPTIEFIRYLFLHNKTLANSIMRPNGLMALFRAEAPGFKNEMKIEFTSEMPSSSLTKEFAQEFAWISMNQDIRQSWDSVRELSLGQSFLTLDPPMLKNSKWHYRGIKSGNQILIFEILHITGKVQPCHSLIYGHPSFKKRGPSGASQFDISSASQPQGMAKSDFPQSFEYEYQLEDDQEGTKVQQNQKSLSMALKRFSFERKITVEREHVISDRRSATSGQSNTASKKIKKTLMVSAGDIGIYGELQPIEFGLLTPGDPEDVGDLAAMEDLLKHMTKLVPSVDISMAICRLKVGKLFSYINRHSRLAMVVALMPKNSPPIYLIDIDHTGDVALSLIAISCKQFQPFTTIEPIIKEVLDGLVDKGGHWDLNVECKWASICHFEHIRKVMTPRSTVDKPKLALFAARLASKLGLMPGYNCT